MRRDLVPQNDALPVKLDPDRKRIGGLLLGGVVLLRKRQTDFLLASALEAHKAVEIAGLLAAVSVDKKSLLDCDRRLVAEMPDGFAELSTVYSKAHEFVPLEKSHRLVRNGERSRKQRLVDSHVTPIFQDARMDHPLCLGEGAA